MKKGIKRDKFQYSELKYDWQWDSWNRSTISTASTHACKDVFTPTYTPNTDEDKELFIENQQFIYSVFEEKLQTDMEKHCVRRYQLSYNAQQIYIEMVEHTSKSIHATLEASKLVANIINVKSHKMSWKGSYHSLILFWCDKLQRYEEVIPSSDHFSDNMKKSFLENSVIGIKALSSVKKAYGRGPLTYNAYLALLLSAASVADTDRGFSIDEHLNIPQPSRKLNINMTDTAYDVYKTEYYDIEDLHNIDAYLIHEVNHGQNQDNGTDAYTNTQKHNNMSTIKEMKSSQQPFTNGPKMAKVKWMSITKEEQQSWDTPSNTAKAIILGIAHPKPLTIFGNNLHHITAADYLTMLHNTNQNHHDATI